MKELINCKIMKVIICSCYKIYIYIIVCKWKLVYIWVFSCFLNDIIIYIYNVVLILNSKKDFLFLI